MITEELPAYGFNCEFGYSSQKTICRWEHDGRLDLKWAVLTSKTGPIQDHTGDGNFIYSQADENQKGKVARLISPIVNPQNSAHCMTFWYHMSGPHVGTLRIKLRYPSPEEYDQVLLTLSGNQGNCWKEGRVLLHKSVKHYQVVVEGEIGKGNGGIAVDDINIDNHIAQEECRKSNDAGNEIAEEEPDINQTGWVTHQPGQDGVRVPYLNQKLNAMQNDQIIKELDQWIKQLNQWNNESTLQIDSK
ncbi:UNVERIFIED_CONTAM: Asparagine-rich protein (ARP protein) [Gekko kuhli]